MNVLDLVPPFKRHINQWVVSTHTDSTLAAYLADGIEALSWRWTREYAITYTAPNTYEVSPDIVVKDKRPIILMASIIYKMGNVDLATQRDGDFAYDPQKGRINPIQDDINELDKLVPSGPSLAKAISSPMRGFSNVLNPESYSWLVGIGAFGQT